MIQDPLEELLKLKQTPAADPLEELVASRSTAPSAFQTKIRKEQKAGILDDRIARENRNEAEQVDAETPSYAGQVFGGIASFGRDIPGVEAAQAGLRSVVRTGLSKVTDRIAPESYREARTAIRAGEDSAPAVVRNLNRIVGGGLAAGVVPGSPVLSGARYGVAHAALQSDPDADVRERTRDAAIEGTIGAASGFVANKVGTAIRAARAKPRSAVMAGHKQAMQRADQVGYGAAEREGAVRSIPSNIGPAVTPDQQGVRTALDQPDIKKFADLVRGKRQFVGADDATVARETFKRMSKREGTLLRKLEVEYDPNLEGELESLQLAKDELRAAAAKLMPSWEGANAQHAAMAKAGDAGKLASRVAGRAVRGMPTPDKVVAREGPEEFVKTAAKMNPAERELATAMTLARAREGFQGSMNPFTGFGALSSIARANRVAPFLDALDQAGSYQTPRLLRSTVVAGLLPSPERISIR